MGQGEEVKTRENPHIDILERGEIFFFYRPKVDKSEAHSPDDVQRLYVVLRPESGPISGTEEKQDPSSGKEGEKLREHEVSKRHEGGSGSEKVDVEKQPLLRVIVMGKKSLPDPTRNRGRPYWGFVDLVTTRPDDVKAALDAQDYDTKTKGHRKTEPARALGEGIYRILKHDPNPGRPTHTHLVYKLEFPAEDEKNEAQESMNVEREGSFIIQIKVDPGEDGSGQVRKRRARFPASLQGKAGRRKFAAADPPDFLNYEGCELLLIAAADDVEEELGVELRTEVENSHDPSCSDLVKMFGQSVAPIKPLLHGTWA